MYALYDAEHKVENVHLPAEIHDYGYSKRVAVYNFFAHHLELNYRNDPYEEGYQEDFVTILPSDELKVFDENAPKPKDLLQGYEAVIDYLGIDLTQ